MKKIAVLLHMAILIAFISASYAQQSLGDLAEQEKERRQEITNGRVITAEEAAKYNREPQTSNAALPKPTPDTAQSEKQESEAANKPPVDNPDADEPTDFMGRPESFWRKTMAEAREKVKSLTNEANVIVLRLADLQNKFYNIDDGFKREDVQREIQKSYYEQDLNKQNLEKAKAKLQDLENEARKSGALPGWIAPGNH